jgi:hypothetical protein
MVTALPWLARSWASLVVKTTLTTKGAKEREVRERFRKC